MKGKNLREVLSVPVGFLVLYCLISVFFFTLESNQMEKESHVQIIGEKSRTLLNILDSTDEERLPKTWQQEIEMLNTKIRFSEHSYPGDSLKPLQSSLRYSNGQEEPLDKAQVRSRLAFLLAEAQRKERAISGNLHQIRLIRVGSEFSVFVLLILWILFWNKKSVRNLNRLFKRISEELSGQEKEGERKEIDGIRPAGTEIFKEYDGAITLVEECRKERASLLKKLKDHIIREEINDRILWDLPVGVMVHRPSTGKIIFTNKNFVNIYGFSPDFIHELEEFHLEKKGIESLGMIRESTANESKIILSAEGTYKSVEVSASWILEHDLQVFFYSHDTNLNEAGELSVLDDELSKMIFNAAEVGLALVDQEGKIKKVNDKFCGIYGYSPEELEGSHFTLLLPDDQVQAYREAYQERMLKMAPLSTSLKEVQVEDKKRSILHVLTSSRLIARPNFKGTIYSVMDITAMKTDQGKLQAAIEGSRIGTWNINMVTGHNEVNQWWARMLGYRQSEVQPGRSFFESLIHPEDIPKFKREVAKISTGEKDSFSIEVRLKCKDGRYKWILDTGKVIKRNSDDTPLIMAGSHFDIDNIKRAQIEIAHNRDRLRRAQEMGMLGDWEIDLSDMNLTCSVMVYRIFGKKKDGRKLTYEELLHHFHPVSSVRLRRDMQKVVKQRLSTSLEAQIFTENGNLKYVKIIAVPILGLQDNVIKISGIIQDVTSLKTTKNSLMETSRRLQVLSDNFPGGLIQLKVSPYLPPQLLYLSKGAEKSWGISREEALEGDVKQLLRRIHPHDHGIIKRSLQVASAKMERLTITWRTVQPDGSIHWHRGIGTPSKNKDKSITWNGLTLDITDRKLAESKVKQQDAYLQVLTTHASDAIAACDNSGKIVFYNPTFQSWFGDYKGFSAGEKSGSEVKLLSIDEERTLKRSEFSLNIALNEGIVRNHEFIVQQEGKSHRYVQASGSSLYDSVTRTKMGAMVVIRDITDRIHKEIEVSNAILHARERERATIAAEIHDGITQSLGVVSMRLKNLGLDHQELITDEGYSKALNYLSSTIDQSRSLAHTLMPNSIQDYGLIVALEELVEQVSSSVDTKVVFAHSGNQKIPAGKELHVFRVLQEGLANALKHSKCNEIRIDLTYQDSFLVATLRDNGIGFNVQKSYLGNGIGLLSMRDRIKKIKGKLRVLSGKDGTVLWIRVPINNKKKSS